MDFKSFATLDREAMLVYIDLARVSLAAAISWLLLEGARPLKLEQG